MRASPRRGVPVCRRDAAMLRNKKKGPGIARDCKNGMPGETAGNKSRLTCTDVHDLYIKFTSQTFNPQLKLGDLLQVIS